MANNFNKIGYSTTEVAQILNCSTTTLRGYINTGKIEAIGADDKITKDHRRTLRITRDSLVKFLSENRNKYPKEIVSKFVKDEPILTDSERAYCKHDMEIISGDWPPKGSYTANNPDELKGAYSESKRLESTKTEEFKRLENSYKITINGSTIPDLKKETVQKIVNALFEDETFKCDVIMIRGL